MKEIIKACIDKNKATVLLLIVILITGYNLYIAMPKEKTPELKIPFALVSCFLDGISPVDSENLLVKPIEEEIRGVKGIKEIKSFAVDNMGYVLIEFIAGYDIDVALAELRAKIDSVVENLPDEADRPIVEEKDMALLPVLNIVLKGPLEERALFKISEDLTDIIRTVPSVLDIAESGKRDEIIEVLIDPKDMINYNPDITMIVNALDKNNRLVTAGRIFDTGVSIRLAGKIEDIKTILDLAILSDGKSYIKLKDIAEIRSTYEDPETHAVVNGDQTVVLEVSKRTGTNIIQTVADVKKVVERYKPLLPPSLQVLYTFDDSQSIKDILKDLQNNIILAVLLVFAIIASSINARSAFVISIAIFGSFLISIMFLNYMGYTLNIVVLFSLILSVGMLVDAAIVVTEYADRKMLTGTSPKQAFTESALEMLYPIVSSTLTTVVVFMPLLFWPGIAGEFMKYLPITVMSTLSASILMSMIFCPVVGSLICNTGKNEKAAQIAQAIEDGDAENVNKITYQYYLLLQKVLTKPKTFVAMTIGLLIVSIVAYNILGKGLQFFPDIEPEKALITIRGQGNYSVPDRIAISHEIEEKLSDLLDTDIDVFYSNSGMFVDFSNMTDDIIAKISLEFKDWKERRKASVVLDEIRERLKSFTGLVIDVEEKSEGPSQGKPVQIAIWSNNWQDTVEAYPIVKKRLSQIPNLLNISDSFSTPEIEWEVAVDRTQAALFSSTTSDIGRYMSLITKGIRLTEYRPISSTEEIDVVLRYPPEYRNITTLGETMIRTSTGSFPLSSVINVTPNFKTKQINRLNGQRIVLLTANLGEGALTASVVKEMKQWLQEEANLKDGVQVDFKGEIEDQKESGNFLSLAFTLAVTLVILVLLYQFNSYFYMMIIITGIVLATSGALVALILIQEPFSVVMSGVGLIALAGIVVNNNIILIDNYVVRIAAGIDPEDAILKACISRVKPILLTAGTTILGLLPMVFGINIDFIGMEVNIGAPSGQWWVQLSTTIAGGMTFATVLTLFFTPSLLKVSIPLFKKLNKEQYSSEQKDDFSSPQ
ncbi:efflux RND transporter permease subunit [Anaplasmataceae bacterium AB001_6]|nr:efflux RND transporter permease subunit [Anaplasmataceae bacterium AB001_6]